MYKKILITGHASGIGCHLARRFHEAGYSVIGMDVNRVDDLPDDIKQIKCDLAKENEVISTFQQIESLDYAVNCAGIAGVRKEIDKLSVSDIRWTWDHIFIPCFLALREELVIMRRNNYQSPTALGKIVNISSFTARYGSIQKLAYSSAKAAITNMTKVAAVENHPDIFINSVSPATIDTAMIRNKYNGNLPNYSNTYLTGDCGSTEDVFLAVDMLLKNNFITGYDLVLDGGYSSNFSLQSVMKE